MRQSPREKATGKKVRKKGTRWTCNRISRPRFLLARQILKEGKTRVKYYSLHSDLQPGCAIKGKSMRSGRASVCKSRLRESAKSWNRPPTSSQFVRGVVKVFATLRRTQNTYRMTKGALLGRNSEVRVIQRLVA